MYKSTYYVTTAVLLLLTTLAQAGIFSKYRHTISNKTEHRVHVVMGYDGTACQNSDVYLKAYNGEHPRNGEPVWAHTVEAGGCDLKNIFCWIYSNPVVEAIPYTTLHSGDGSWFVQKKADGNGYEVVKVANEKYKVDR